MQFENLIKMKRTIIFLLTLTIGFALQAQTYNNYDFSSVAPSGQKLYYHIESNDSEAVLVRPQKGYSPVQDYKPSGDIIIPSTVEFMGIQFPVTAIGENAFENCRVTSVKIPNSIRDIRSYAFKGCSLKSVDIPSSVMEIGKEAFRNNPLTKIELSENIFYIGDYAFASCNLKKITVLCRIAKRKEHGIYYNTNPRGIFVNNPIEEAFFEQYINIPMDHLKSITFGDKTQTIPVLSNCSNLKKVIVGDGIKTIPEGCFENCENLNIVVLGKNVRKIGARAFRKCINLDTIYAKSSIPPTLSDASFIFTPHDLVVVTYCGADYTAAWGEVGNYITENVYTLHLDVNCSACGNAIIKKNVDCNNTAIIEALPNTNYCFTEWNDGNTNNPREITLTKNTTIKAMFEKNAYNVTATSNSTIMGDAVGGGGSYKRGESVTLSAIPKCGYRFKYWSGGSIDNPLTFIPSSDTNLIAFFDIALDTIFVPDTSLETIVLYDTTIYPVTIFDTAIVNVTQYDTTILPVILYDTNIVVIKTFDTVNHTTHIYDTIHQTKDKTYLLFYNAYSFRDTISINDTINNKEGGIHGIKANLYYENGNIVVDGALGETIKLCNATGETLELRKKNRGVERFKLPNSGLYIIKIGNEIVRKFVVIK